MPATTHRTAGRARVNLEQHRRRAQEVFGKLPCKIQAKVSIAQMEGKNVVFISGTGTGKTYTFWLPLLHDEDTIVVVISPLNVLGSKQADDVTALEAAGIRAIALDGDSCSEENIKDIVKGVYRVVIMPPELVHDGRLARVWSSAKFTSRLSRLIFDEAHCLSKWGRTFRPAYLRAAEIRWRLPDHVRFYLASATMPDDVLKDCLRIVGLNRDSTTIIHCSNDRPNIRMAVRPMKYTQKSLADLAFIVPRDGDSFAKPPKFMVFCNARKETERVAQYLRRRLGRELQDKIVWFHSGMSKEFRDSKFEDFRAGKLWGMACTDAAGMGLDVSDVELVVQWKATPSLCTLMQRFGRGARDPELDALAILIIEKFYIRDVKTQAKKRPRGSRDKDDDADAFSDDEASDGEDGQAVGAASAEADTACPPPSQSPAAITTAPAITPSTALSRRPKKRQRTVLDESMDDWANANLKPCKCRRGVADGHFGNATVEKQEYCCPRCAPRTVRVCCDLCCPSKFEVPALDPRDRPARQKRGKKAKLEPYTRNTSELQLQEHLYELRATYGKKLFGSRPRVAEAFLSDDMVDLLVDLAHEHALINVEALLYHTSWVFTDDYGQVIIDEVLRFVPLPAPPPAPAPAPAPTSATTLATPAPARALTDITNTTNAPLTKKPRKRTQCKQCRMFGHNKSNKSCPGSPEAAAALADQAAHSLTPAQLLLVRAAAAVPPTPTPIPAPGSHPGHSEMRPTSRARSVSSEWEEAALMLPLSPSNPIPARLPPSPMPSHTPARLQSTNLSPPTHRSVSPEWEEAALLLPLSPPHLNSPVPLLLSNIGPSSASPNRTPASPLRRVSTLASWTPSPVAPTRFYARNNRL